MIRRWLKFHAVGAMGILVQLAALALFQTRMNYLTATALAVECAILHNFVWHQHWTWRDRGGVGGNMSVAGRLLRFHLGNGAVSLLSNLLAMRLLVGYFDLPVLIANLCAIALASLANFAVSEKAVFTARG